MTYSEFPPVRSRITWIAIVLLFFGLVYACSLTFVYIDPDDASSIAYHALNRNQAIQPPFEYFQFGMDTILSLLPAKEPLVLISAMSVTALAAVGVVLLLLRLSFTTVPVRRPEQKSVIAITLLLAAPELTYLGLLYTPMLVGICAALGAHLLVRHGLSHGSQTTRVGMRSNATILLSSTLLGIAGFFRWDILAYGVVIVLDLLIDPTGTFTRDARPFWKRVRLSLVWGTVAMFVWLGLVLVTTNPSAAIADVVMSVEETRRETHVADPRIIGAHAVLFTPAFFLLTLTGWILMVLKKGPMRWFVLLMSLLAGAWPFWSVPKEVLMFVPFFVTLFVVGLLRMWESRRRTLLAIPLAILILLPWIVGVQMFFGDSAWGPGFGLRSFSHPVSSGIQGVHLVVGDGAGFPTNEGPRPVFGHATVLLGGKWRALARTLADEQAMALDKALSDAIPYLVLMHYDAFQVNGLARLGFTTRDSMFWRHKDTPVIRHFENATGRRLTVVRFEMDRIIRDTTAVRLTMQSTGGERVVVWGEPGITRGLYLFAPDALQELGPRTGVLDLHKLLDAVREKSAKRKP